MPEGYTEIDVKLIRGVTKAKAYVLVKKNSYDSEEEFKEALINFVCKFVYITSVCVTRINSE